MAELQSFDWHWQRAIFVNEEITDKLVSSLAPEILRLKETSPDPITVGIDSPGGNIAAASNLLSLLKAPGRTGVPTTVITVAINKAFSAAASLLALGDYAIALPSAQIHYHDVRFSTFFDLTSSKAVEAARELQRENDRMALLLADSVVERLTWIFIGLQPSFDQAKKDFPALVADVNDLGMDAIWAAPGPKLDFAGFVCGQYAHTSTQGDSLIQEALQKLKAWRRLEIAYREFQKANQPASSEVALFRDDNPLITVVNSGLGATDKFSWTNREGLQRDLVLLLLLLFRKATKSSSLRVNEMTIADLMTEYAFVREIRRQKHIDSAMTLMLQNDYILFDDYVSKKINEAESDEKRRALLGVLFPQVQVFWAYVVLMCRSLFDGEHPISLDDALFLGLIDEVAGRDVPRSKRIVRNEYLRSEAAKMAQLQQPLRKWLKPRRQR